MARHNSDLFYTCSLIEYIGRERKLKRSQVVRAMGEKNIRRIYQYADVFHCEPIAKTSDEFITSLNIPEGDFDNVSACRYTVPDYWTIGQVYERLIVDISGGDEDLLIDRLIEVYTSWIDSAISNYNTDFYYQTRDYIRVCYEEGQICA